MNIAIRGTGKFGRYIAQKLRENEEYTLKYYIDVNLDVCRTYIDGIFVISPDEFQNQYIEEIDCVLVAFMNGIDQFKQIVKSSKCKYGFIRNRVFEAKMDLNGNLLLDNNIIWSDADYLKKPVLRSIETNIVDDCNLNCRGCSHFSNLFEHGAKVPFERYCQDLKQITDHVFVGQFNMLGGEAILNERIIEYIEYARKLLPYSEIELISNGLLLPKMSDDFYKCCARNDITISISGYRPTLMMKDKIKDILTSHNITYIFREDVMEFGKNIDLSGSSNKYEAVKRCRENKCHFFRYGKIYKCPFEALGNIFFSHFGVDIQFEGGTDIYDVDLNWSKLIDKLYEEPVEVCKFCGKEERIEWKVQNKPTLEDWIV